MWWIALALIIAGILLMFVEFLLVPGVGVAGVFSLLSLGAACWYTFYCIGYSAGWWVTSVVLALLLVFLFIILRTKTWKKLELNTDVTSKVNFFTAARGRQWRYPDPSCSYRYGTLRDAVLRGQIVRQLHDSLRNSCRGSADN